MILSASSWEMKKYRQSNNKRHRMCYNNFGEIQDQTIR